MSAFLVNPEPPPTLLSARFPAFKPCPHCIVLSEVMAGLRKEIQEKDELFDMSFPAWRS